MLKDVFKSPEVAFVIDLYFKFHIHKWYLMLHDDLIITTF